MNSLQALAELAGRVLLSTIFIVSGASKIGGFEETGAYMDSMGVPSVLLPAVIAVEILAGLAIVLGWWTRLAAFVLAGFCLASAVLFHLDFGDQIQAALFLKNVAIAGGLAVLLAHGAGPWSVDGRSRRPSQR